MKKTLTSILLLLSVLSYSQDSIVPHITTRKEKAKFYGIIAVIMSPCILIYSQVNSKDVYGKISYAPFAAASIATGVISLYYSDHTKVLSNSFFCLAGALDAFSQELLYHYPQVKRKMPYLNDQFFDPSISWQNKYNSNIPFSKTLLVGTTDGYHASRVLNKMFVVGGIFTIQKPKSIKRLVTVCFIYTFTKGATHYIITN